MGCWMTFVCLFVFFFVLFCFVVVFFFLLLLFFFFFFCFFFFVFCFFIIYKVMKYRKFLMKKNAYFEKVIFSLVKI